MSQALRLLYTSRLSGRSSIPYVGEFVKKMRKYCKEHELTGMLVFDGESIAQYLEGNRASVQRLMNHLQEDTRFDSVNTLMFRETDAQPEFPTWSMAYPRDDAFDSLKALSDRAGDDAVQYFKQLQPTLDVV